MRDEFRFMVSRLLCLGALLQFLIGSMSDGFATPAYDFTPVTATMQQATDDLELRGSGLRILVHGRLAYEQFLGAHDVDTVVPVASSSKTLSAAVIMALVDDGLLALDDRVAQYIPSFNKPGGHADITIRQCFSHTSGLPGDEEDPVLSDTSISLAQAADIIAERTLIGPPGGQFAYGGLSMQVAGRCAEVAAGKSWDDIFRETIANPLGLTHVDYTTIALLPPYRTNPNPRIAGGVRCSMRDYSVFFQMLLNRGVHNGTRVLSEAAVREMQRDQIVGVPVVDSPRAGEIHYGIGIWIDSFDAAGTPTLTFAAGAFGFVGWLDPARDVAGVYQVVNQFGNVEPYVFQMINTTRTIIDSTPPSPADEAARIVNLSSRAPAAAGDATLIAGFVVGGDSRSLVVRGIGPALADFDVPDVLADPVLNLFNDTTPIGSNDDWSGDDGRTLGAFALAAGSRDAVVNIDLAPGLYTAQVTPKPGTVSGEALAELYDAGGPDAGRLVNLSTRTALTAGGTLIGGFVITGSAGAEKRILVRAAGPTLAGFDVGDPLANPQLLVYDADGTLIAGNDDWGGTSALAAAFAATGAFPFAAPDSRDAALVLALPPGGYTVHLQSPDPTATGVALVEIYELP